jgi:hypothetical protein
MFPRAVTFLGVLGSWYRYSTFQEGVDKYVLGMCLRIMVSEQTLECVAVFAMCDDGVSELWIERSIRW